MNYKKFTHSVTALVKQDCFDKVAPAQYGNSLKVGKDTQIKIKGQYDEDWYLGEYNGISGAIPLMCVYTFK